MTICAIHQPNFFPWLGYFDKIKHADVFVFLDAVAYPKSGSGNGSWVNRVKIPIQQRPQWVGCPIKREPGVQLIKDVIIDDQQPWRKKLWRTLEINYAKAANFKKTLAFLEPLIFYDNNNLAAFNIHAIRSIAAFFDLKAMTISQSELLVTGKATDLLIKLTQTTQADTYLCGGGAAGYQEDGLFEQSNIKLAYQNFVVPIYGQGETCFAGMSIIDFMMRATPDDIHNFFGK